MTPKLAGTTFLPQDLPGEAQLQLAWAGGRKHSSLSQTAVAGTAQQQGAELQAQPVPGTTMPWLRDKQPWPSNELPQFLLPAVLWSSVLNNSGELLNCPENTSRSVLMSSPRTCCPRLSLHHHTDVEQAQGTTVSLNAVVRLAVGSQTPGQLMQHHEHLVARGRRAGHVLSGACQAIGGQRVKTHVRRRWWGKEGDGENLPWAALPAQIPTQLPSQGEFPRAAELLCTMGKVSIVQRRCRKTS